MSRRESDREDLLREATALALRAELKIPEFAEPIVVGFRRDGSASVYFGGDPVYHFNTAGELRRAYVAGLLYKAERCRLVSLARQRGEHEVALVRTELSPAESAAVLDRLQDCVIRLRRALADCAFILSGQVPADANIVQRMGDWLATLPEPISIAEAPNAS